MKRLFEANTICRLCLRVEEKAYKINNTNHTAFIESIIKLKNIQYLLPDALYVCCICNAFIAKCYNFAQTLWKTQEIICVLLKTTDIITKRMLDGIDRHNNGLNPITLSSVVTYGNKIINDSSNDGHTSTDIEEVDLDVLVDKMFKKSKQIQERKKKHNISDTKYHLRPNSSSDENERIPTLYLDEEEVEIGNIDKETSDIFVDSFIKVACDKPKRKKPTTQDIKEKIRKTTKRLYRNNKSVEIAEDYCSDATSSSTANKNKRKNKSVEIAEDSCSDAKSSSTANKNKGENRRVEIAEDNYSDAKSSPTTNKNKRKNKRVEIAEDYCSDSTSSSTANKNKRKKSDEFDKDYCPDSSSHSDDSEYDLYDDEGKPIKVPKDKRVYPMQCDHCDFVLPEKRDHYRHYQYCHPDIEYPYKFDTYCTCTVCGKLVPQRRIRDHEDNHATNEFKCSLCPKICDSKVKLSRHMTDVHPKRTFICDYCSKEFKTKRDFHRHIRIHTGDKPFKCHICGAGFAHSGNRSIHIRIKHQNYKYKPKKNEKTQKKRRKNIRSNKKEVYDTSDDEPLIRAATNPQRINKTPSGDSNVKPKRKCKKQGPIQNGIGESKEKS